MTWLLVTIRPSSRRVMPVPAPWPWAVSVLMFTTPGTTLPATASASAVSAEPELPDGSEPFDGAGSVVAPPNGELPFAEGSGTGRVGAAVSEPDCVSCDNPSPPATPASRARINRRPMATLVPRPPPERPDAGAEGAGGGVHPPEGKAAGGPNG